MDYKNITSSMILVNSKVIQNAMGLTSFFFEERKAFKLNPRLVLMFLLDIQTFTLDIVFHENLLD